MEIEGVHLPEGTPIIELDVDNPEKSKQALNFALWSTGGSSDYRNDRNRPYNGQPHTGQGERGKTLVEGLTMRDICDCFVRGWLRASGQRSKVEDGTWRYRDVYSDYDVDPLAVQQNMMCEVEKMMGIFPNVPELNPEPSHD